MIYSFLFCTRLYIGWIVMSERGGAIFREKKKKKMWAIERRTSSVEMRWNNTTFDVLLLLLSSSAFFRRRCRTKPENSSEENRNMKDALTVDRRVGQQCTRCGLAVGWLYVAPVCIFPGLSEYFPKRHHDWSVCCYDSTVVQ